MRQIIKKPLAFFKVDNIRKEFDEESLRKLGASMKKRLLYPIVAKPDGTIVDGERRLRAAALSGLESLDAILVDEPMTATELRVMQLVSAIHRAELPAWDVYQGCYEIAQRNPDKKDKELAELVSIAPESLCKIMAPSKCIPEVRKAMQEGRVGTSVVYAISKAAETDQLALLEAALQGATRDELERRRRKRPPADGRSTEAKRFKAVLPDSGVSVGLSGKSLGLSEVIDALTELLKLARKAEKERLDVKTWESVLRDQAKGGAA